MSELQPAPHYCSRCGTQTQHKIPAYDTRDRQVCPNCETIHYVGPRLMILSVVFAEERLLLVRRGQDPYRDKWAPPGGFVEEGESLETAVMRETREEVGIELPADQILPFGLFSLPTLNQVYACFVSKLDRLIPVRPNPPETVDAQWFLQQDFPFENVWDPALDFDIELIYQRSRFDRFDFYQRTDDSMRLITDGCVTRKIWPA